MATFHGSGGLVKIGTDTVAEVLSFSLTEGFNLVPDHELSDGWASNKAGRQFWSGTVECRWDDTDANGQEAIMTAVNTPALLTLHLLPEGATTGDEDFTGTVWFQEVETQIGDDEIVSRTFSFTGDGALTRGTAS